MAKAPKTTTTELVVINSEEIKVPATKADVPAAIEALKSQLAGLKGNQKESISLEIEYDAGEKIKDVKSVSRLLEMSASIHARAKAYAEETKRYDLVGKVKDFTHSEKTVEEWQKIINKGIFELVNAGKIKQLESAIEKLSKFVDEETRLKNELDGIMNLAAEKLS